jgi:hypothetical protein
MRVTRTSKKLLHLVTFTFHPLKSSGLTLSESSGKTTPLFGAIGVDGDDHNGTWRWPTGTDQGVMCPSEAGEPGN